MPPKTTHIQAHNPWFGYPFGMTMEKHTVSEGKFGFNGKENIEEIDGWQDYGERMYNRLIGRFPTADPLIVYKQQYPELSSYQFASNSPIHYIDLDGLEGTEYEINDDKPLLEAPSQDNITFPYYAPDFPTVVISEKPWYIKVRDFFRGKSGFNVTSPDGLSSNQAPDEYRSPEKNVDGEYFLYLQPNTGPRSIFRDKFYLRKPDAIAKGVDNSTKVYSEVVEQIPSSNNNNSNFESKKTPTDNPKSFMKDSFDLYTGKGDRPYRKHKNDANNANEKGRQLKSGEKEINEMR